MTASAGQSKEQRRRNERVFHLIKFKQHIPNFCDGFEPYEIECDTLEQLLSHERIQSWTKYPDFHRFSWTPPEPEKHRPLGYLMCENKEGREWWVVGYIDTKDKLDLPIWSAKERAV